MKFIYIQKHAKELIYIQSTGKFIEPTKNGMPKTGTPFFIYSHKFFHPNLQTMGSSHLYKLNQAYTLHVK